MANFRFRGPICQTRDWFDGLDEGTLARGRTPTVGPVTGGTANQAPRRVRVTAKGLCAFLNPQAQGTVQAPASAFKRLRDGSDRATISDPTPRSSYTWPDKSTSSAIERRIEIGSQSFVLIVPGGGDSASKNLPTPGQVAEALRVVPSAQRALTKTVVVCPTAAPGSNSRETTAGMGGSGVVELYPVDRAQTQNDFDNRMTHECGHNYHEKFWQGSPEEMQRWQSAADADAVRPSPYAARNTGEDFCEFLILYNTTQGTSCEETAQKIYPNRWNKMRSYVSL
jgi:hypothetical protein